MVATSCVVCDKEIGARQHKLQCTVCTEFVHRTCLDSMSNPEFSQIKNSWKCVTCRASKKSATQATMGNKMRASDDTRRPNVEGQGKRLTKHEPSGPKPNGHFKCSICSRFFELGEHKLQCTLCQEYAHRKCLQPMTAPEFAIVKTSWSCRKCEDAVIKTKSGYLFLQKDVTTKLQQRELPVGQVFDYMKFAHLNVNGIKSKWEDIEYYLQKQNNLIVLALAESKLTFSDESDFVQFHGYSLYREDRGFGERGGGQLIYVNNECRYELIEFNEVPPGLVECNILRIKLTSMPTTIVCVIYVPPQFTRNPFFEYFKNLCNFLRSNRKTKGRRVVIMGDFNVHWGRETSNHRKLNETCMEYDFKQVIKQPTRKDAILDHIYTDIDSKVTSQVSQLSTSDHKLISVIFK